MHLKLVMCKASEKQLNSCEKKYFPNNVYVRLLIRVVWMTVRSSHNLYIFPFIFLTNTVLQVLCVFFNI